MNDGLGNVTTPNFSELTNTAESIETLIKWHVGSETDIDAFRMSLCRTILESRNLRTEQERICVLVDWLIDQLDLHSERGEERASIAKYLLRKVVLSEWNGPQTQNNRSRKLSRRRRRSLKLNTAKTASLLNLAMSSKSPQFDVQSEIERLSASIRKANLTAKTCSDFDTQKMARFTCDLLTMILNLQHESVEMRLESVKKEIEDFRDRLSFVLLMDEFFFITRNMNIFVTPHSILKVEARWVFSQNVRDTGLSEWVQTATETLLDLIDTPETDCVNYHEQTKTRKMQLEERVLDTVTSSILTNVNGTIKSIEAIRLNPTLFFVNCGSDFFTSPNIPCLDGVDTTTDSRAFPIPFSTGYKETYLREEKKQVFEPLARLLPDNFPTGRPSLVHVDNEGKQEQNKTSSSKKEADDRARGIVGSAILRMGATSMTPLFMFVVDEDLADHSSLPMSLLSSDESAGRGMMRQRSLADVLWILFLTRISREVMALPLNTSINSADFSNSVIPFLSNALIDAKVLQHSFYSYSIPTVLNTLISRATTRRLNNRNRISSVGLELLEPAYPHVKDQTHVLLLSCLLMACPSHQKGRSRLDVLIDHPSPKVGLVALIRWFQLLSSFAKTIKFEKAIESNGFTLAKVETLLLRAFYQIVEHNGPDDLITQLYEAIKSLLILERQPLFFRTAQQQTLDELKLVADTRCETHTKDSPRGKVLFDVAQWIARHLTLLTPAQSLP
ncbi:hypothetical protein BLNAU_17610 [Blattamonas nauphoetae]|uniref:Uncharacterized protein n=1 Tax=Blattamonas nauphoetae TaxID=2049346 RepID=A0ABQ9X6Z1_9EUKA|nr:hypothetical protein BLNAU_17610 [Blattamonas nauphoetae]